MYYVPKTDTVPLAEDMFFGALLFRSGSYLALLVAWCLIALDISRHQFEYGDEVEMFSWIFLALFVLGGVLYIAAHAIEQIAMAQFARRGPNIRVLP